MPFLAIAADYTLLVRLASQLAGRVREHQRGKIWTRVLEYQDQGFTMPSVVITTEVLPDVPGTHVDVLRAAGYDVHFPARTVLATEPATPNHPLLALENVIVSPHVAALDTQAVEDIAVGATQNILDIHQGKRPTDDLINLDVKAAWNG